MPGELLWATGICALICSIIMVLRVRRSATLGDRNVGAFTKLEFALVFICTFVDPIIVQAIYYYGLKNVAPRKAKMANIVGFVLFVPSMLVYIFLTSAR